LTDQSCVPPSPGARYRLTRDLDRFPHFVAPAGLAGTIVEAGRELVLLHMDLYLPGAEDWDNEIAFTPEDDHDQHGAPASDPSAARAFHASAEPLVEPLIPAGATESPAHADARRFPRNSAPGLRVEHYCSPEAGQGATVYLGETLLGTVGFHTAERGASGLAAVAYWYANTPGGEFVNRTIPPGLARVDTALSGQEHCEQAVALLIAAHSA
jgi:hypothetical protein